MAPTSRPGNYFNSASSTRVLIQQAYGMTFFQQLGGPDWIREDTYIINAKLPDGVDRTPDNLRVMVRNLLADRFKLVVREEERELPVYALAYARADKRLGPQLKPVTVNCEEQRELAECSRRISMRPGSMALQNTQFAQIAPQFEFVVNRPVIDRTGLTGPYHLNLSYAPENAIAAGTAELPSLFTAVEEQLGLKLESTRAPMKVVVIDSIQKPTED